jgi:hypothetical protein
MSRRPSVIAGVAIGYIFNGLDLGNDSLDAGIREIA